MNPAPGRAVVFHRGALGDFILVWPMLRMLIERGWGVELVTDGAKGRLAASLLGVCASEVEQARFNRLWLPDFRPEPVLDIRRVISFLADERSPAGARWARGAREMFPDAAVECIPGPIDRPTALRLADRGGVVTERLNPDGPAVLHIGAGAAGKRWPIERWAALTDRLRGEGPVEAIAGEVEAERLTPEERRIAAGMNARFIESLEELAGRIGGARVFVGADTGPTHLAAQLGVPTVALFGATDPERWAPIGPRVRVVAPGRAEGMGWLGVRIAEAAMRDALSHSLR